MRQRGINNNFTKQRQRWKNIGRSSKPRIHFSFVVSGSCFTIKNFEITKSTIQIQTCMCKLFNTLRINKPGKIRDSFHTFCVCFIPFIFRFCTKQTDFVVGIRPFGVQQYVDYINALFIIIDCNKIKAYALYFASNWNTFIPLVFLSGCMHTLHMFNRLPCAFVWVFYVFVEAERERTHCTMCGDKRCKVLCFAHHFRIWSQWSRSWTIDWRKRLIS